MNKAVFIRIARILILLLAMVASIGFWFYLQRPDVLPIKNVRVEGSFKHISREQVQKSALPWVKTGFFALSPSVLREHLLTIPWLADATISRGWPDTITIHVTEKQALARWGDKGVITPEGDVFYPEVKTISAKLPLFRGEPAQAQLMATHFLALQAELKTLGLSITELTCSKRQAWTALLQNDIRLEFGRTDILKRLKRFTRAYHKIIGSHGSAVEKVDLRYHNGLAVRWKQV